MEHRLHTTRLADRRRQVLTGRIGFARPLMQAMSRQRQRRRRRQQRHIEGPCRPTHPKLRKRTSAQSVTESCRLANFQTLRP